MNQPHALLACQQTDASRQDWAAAYRQVRAHTLQISAGLSAEDQALQSMPDASPTKCCGAGRWLASSARLRRPVALVPMDRRARAGGP